MIGIDLLEIARLERALERRPGLAERLFSERELEFCRARAHPAKHLAARFCAKEAAVKALGRHRFALAEVEVEGGGDEPPRLVLHGAAADAAAAEGVELEVSLTHTGETAAAVVLAPDRPVARGALPGARRGRAVAISHLGCFGWRPGWNRSHDAATMRAADRWAIEERGIPSLELMEKAGAALAEECEARSRQGPVRIVCGKGNNGGDGLVAARLLASFGHTVEVLLLAPAGELAPDAAENMNRFDGPVAEPGNSGWEQALAGSGCVVDAIFGTGFSGAPREPASTAIAAINGCDAPVVAADIASGVDASTGEVAGAAVEADATVSFHAAKLGQLIAPGKWHCGELLVAPIGIPDGAPEPAPGGVIGAGALDLAPKRDPRSTKFSSGQVLIVGGSRGLTGSVCLTATAAIRAGAGYATVAVPDELEAIFEIKLTEVMSRGMPSIDGGLAALATEPILEAARRAAAVVVGPGMGRSDDARELVGALARELDAPLLIDADGLHGAADDLDALAARRAPRVLTPHAGELGVLLGVESDQIAAHRLASAREAASRTGAVVVLKGDDTIVAGPDGELAVNSVSSPALATAGTGDVLSGVVGALLARGLAPFAAACAGVRAHACAGRSPRSGSARPSR